MNFLHTLAVSTSTFTGMLAQTEYETPSAGAGIAGALGGLVWLVLMVALIAGMWKMYAKAGKPGWASIVPIYNIIVLLEIAGKPLWWIILLIIPFVNFVVVILVMIALAKSFGKGAGFGIGLTFLSFIFIPILGFGDAKYVGPQASNSLT